MDKTYDDQKDVSRQAILEELEGCAEESYRIFSSKLLPPGETLLGVRLPILRKLAGKIAKGNWKEYLKQAGDRYFEEVMLQGMVIGKTDMDWDEKKKWIQWFVPKINNWSVCDSFCSSLKGKDMEKTKSLLPIYFKSEKEYEVRFALVMHLMGDRKAEDFPYIWDGIQHMKSKAYYAKMAAAWVISIYFRDHPITVMPYLEDSSGMDQWIYKKSLQKIIESRTVEAEDKKKIRQLQKKAAVEKAMI